MMQFFNVPLLLFLLLFYTELSAKELTEAIHKSLANNHQLKSAEFMLKVAEQGKYQSFATVLPTASLMMTFDPGKSASQGNAEININQPLFNFGYSYFDFKKNKSATLMQQSSFNLTKKQVITNAVSAYVSLFKAREITKLRTKTVNFMKKHLEIAHKRFDLGEITKSDLAQAKSKLSSAVADLVKASADENILVASYTRIIGESPPKVLNYPSAELKLPSTLSEALSQATKNNSYLKMAHYNKEVSNYSAKETYLNILPSVSLNASWKYNNAFTSSSVQYQNATGIGVLVPIFQGGAEYGKMLSAKYKFYSSIQDYYEAIKSVEESVISAWLNCKAAQSLIKASLDSVSAYEAAVESVAKEVSLNTKSILDLLDVEISLLSAGISLVDARSSHIISNYNLVLNVSDVDVLFR